MQSRMGKGAVGRTEYVIRKENWAYAINLTPNQKSIYVSYIRLCIPLQLPNKLFVKNILFYIYFVAMQLSNNY